MWIPNVSRTHRPRARDDGLGKAMDIIATEREYMHHYRYGKIRPAYLSIGNYWRFIRCSDSTGHIRGIRLYHHDVAKWMVRNHKTTRRSEMKDCKLLNSVYGKKTSVLSMSIFQHWTYHLPRKPISNMYEYVYILHSSITQYNITHRIIICGDFNGTLHESGVHANLNYVNLRVFVIEHGLTRNNSQIYEYDGCTSQIGYILTSSKNLFADIVTADQQPTTLSTHVSVSSMLSIRQNYMKVQIKT